MSSVLAKQLLALQRTADDILASDAADTLDEDLLLIVQLLQCRLRRAMARLDPLPPAGETDDSAASQCFADPLAAHEPGGLFTELRLFSETGDLFADYSSWDAIGDDDTRPAPDARDETVSAAMRPDVPTDMQPAMQPDASPDMEVINVRIEGAELDRPFHTRISIAERDQLCETGRFHIRHDNFICAGPGLDRWSAYLISYLEEFDDGLLIGVETEAAYQAKREAARRAEREREDMRRATYEYLRIKGIAFDARPLVPLQAQVANTMNAKAVADFGMYVSRLNGRFAANVVRMVSEGKPIKKAIAAVQAELMEASLRKVGAMRGLLRYRRAGA